MSKNRVYHFITAREIEKILNVAESEDEFKHVRDLCDKTIAQYREIMNNLNPLRIRAKIEMKKLAFKRMEKEEVIE